MVQILSRVPGAQGRVFAQSPALSGFVSVEEKHGKQSNRRSNGVCDSSS